MRVSIYRINIDKYIEFTVIFCDENRHNATIFIIYEDRVTLHHIASSSSPYISPSSSLYISPSLCIIPSACQSLWYIHSDTSQFHDLLYTKTHKIKILHDHQKTRKEKQNRAKNIAQAQCIMQMEIHIMAYGSMISKQVKVSTLGQMVVVMSSGIQEWHLIEFFSFL